MKRKIMACVMAVIVSIGLVNHPEMNVMADTTITEEEMEDTAEDSEKTEANWQIRQKLDATSCQQGKMVTLTVYLTGDVDSLCIATIYAEMQYDPEVFEVSLADITPNNSKAVDYVSFDEESGEVEVYYAEDVSFESGSAILKMQLHVLSDAPTGTTQTGLNSLELYATDSDDYAVIENVSNVDVSIKKNSGTAVVLGDVNQDKKVNLTDAKMIMKYCNGETKFSATQKKNADVNKDGKVNLTDVKLVMKYCNGAIKKF